MIEERRDDEKEGGGIAGFVRRIRKERAGQLALAGVLGASWVGGAVSSAPRYDSATGVSPFTSTTAESTDLASAEWDLPNLDHERVDYWVERFTTDKRPDFEHFLERSGRFIPMMEAKLQERGLPRDLIYLSMIESGFDPLAYSRADASGLWQFIEATGRRYGLEINRNVDERNDPEKATDAALDYLTDLHDQFGSWYLSAAAYNTGEGRIARIMREVTGSERGTEESYYEIYNRLPKETRDYVPLMIAAARISKEPAKYGFEHVQTQTPWSYEEVVVEPSTPLARIASASGVDITEIRSLNPHLKGDHTRADRRQVVRVPKGARSTFLVNWPEARQKDGTRADAYKLRQGDPTLLSMARGANAGR
ncbi:MAG: lytic transglycosylase domain-containing protein [Gemmatimonadota bacterium]|jgi:membrane-bound lytic murein transglycosylase D|nr:lytic transglycosylase domain-containing protein [Gemmatimonadota bacterium]